MSFKLLSCSYITHLQHTTHFDCDKYQYQHNVGFITIHACQPMKTYDII